MEFTEVLVAHLLPRDPALDAAARAVVVRDAARCVERFFASAPAHVRLAVAAVGIVFRACALIGRWRGAAHAFDGIDRLPGPAALVLRLYRSFALMAFYEHPLVEAALGLESPADRQARFRALRAAALAAEGAAP